MLGHEEPVRTVLNLGGGVLATGSLDHTTIIWGATAGDEGDEEHDKADDKTNGATKANDDSDQENKDLIEDFPSM